MTDAELDAIAKRWSGGAHVVVERNADPTVSPERWGYRVPYAGDVPALLAEVRRLRGELDQTRGEHAARREETRKDLAQDCDHDSAYLHVLPSVRYCCACLRTEAAESERQARADARAGDEQEDYFRDRDGE